MCYPSEKGTHRASDQVPRPPTGTNSQPTVNMNELKYDELKSYLSKVDFRRGLYKHVTFKRRRLTKNFEYDPATSVVYYVYKDNKNGLLSTALSTNPRLNKSQGKILTTTNTDNQP